MWHPGWQSVGCNSITVRVRLKCSGVRPHTVSIRSRLYPSVLVALLSLLCNRSLLFGISGFTTMLMLPCALSHDCNYPCTFCHSAADQQHSMFTVTSSLVDLALVISKLDYCSTVLAGAPETLLQRLQSVLNAAAWLVFSCKEDLTNVSTAPRTTSLAQSSRAYQVSAKHADLPLCSWLSAELPCRDHSSSFKPCRATLSMICQYFNLVGYDNMSFDTGWLHISGVCNESLEFPAFSCQGRGFTARLPPRTQN